MHDWSKLITAGVGPIIVISACGLLCLAFYNRLAAVVTRMRAFHREQLHEQEELARERARPSPDGLVIVRRQEVLGMLEVQRTRVLRRARWIRRTIASLLITIGCLAACSLLVGLGAIWPGGTLLVVAAVLFGYGLLMMILAVAFALVEISGALDPVELESRFITEMAEAFDRVQR
jgi:uncharacterized membrane protein